MAKFCKEKSDDTEVKAPVNRIIPFSAVDGPGNRSTIFLQGCNFDCPYCHNPETRNLCRSCGDCLAVCKAGALTLVDGKVTFHTEKCCSCDNCIKTCQHGCSPRICLMTAREVFAEVKKQMPFIRGVTVSGGECTLYPKFLQELFVNCRENGLDTLIDSNGTLDFSNSASDLLAVTDGVMLDIKVWNEEEHRQVIGPSNQMVLTNAEYLAKLGKLIEVRTVIVPGLFDYEQTVVETARLLAPYLPVYNIRYKIIAYRKFGVRPGYADYETPSGQELDRLASCLAAEGFEDIVII